MDQTRVREMVIGFEVLIVGLSGLVELYISLSFVQSSQEGD